MDRKHVELFANSYPQKTNPSSPPRLSPGMMRTPLREVMPSNEGFHPKKSIPPKESMSDTAKQGTKKFFAILLITLVGALLYSAFAYTISDSLFSKFGVIFFDDKGSPGMTIIVIHSVIFLAVIYLILGALKWW